MGKEILFTLFALYLTAFYITKIKLNSKNFYNIVGKVTSSDEGDISIETDVSLCISADFRIFGEILKKLIPILLYLMRVSW